MERFDVALSSIVKPVATPADPVPAAGPFFSSLPLPPATLANLQRLALAPLGAACNFHVGMTPTVRMSISAYDAFINGSGSAAATQRRTRIRDSCAARPARHRRTRILAG